MGFLQFFCISDNLLYMITPHFNRVWVYCFIYVCRICVVITMVWWCQMVYTLLKPYGIDFLTRAFAARWCCVLTALNLTDIVIAVLRSFIH
jgi:hypothetical protein